MPAGKKNAPKGILDGLLQIVERLSDLAQTGEQLKSSGTFGVPGEKLNGVYGFNVKVGIGDQGVKVEPFGNVGRDEKTGQAVVKEVREPIVDVFDEGREILVVAEMPGVSREDVKLEVIDDVLRLSAGRAKKKYHKEVLLGAACLAEGIRVTCNNGVLQARLKKKAAVK